MTSPTVNEVDYGSAQNTVEFYPPPLRAVRHLLSFLQWRFSLLPIGTFHWEPTEESSVDAGTSEILIAKDTPLSSRMLNSRPAITVMRSQAQFQGIGLGDVVFHDWQTGGKSRMDLIPTTLCVNVLSRSPVVAERLAWFVQEQVFVFREEIIREEPCLLAIGQRTQLSPPSPAGALVSDSNGEDWSVVSLFLPTYLQHLTVSEPLNVPVLQALKTLIRVRTEGTPR